MTAELRCFWRQTTRLLSSAHCVPSLPLSLPLSSAEVRAASGGHRRRRSPARVAPRDRIHAAEHLRKPRGAGRDGPPQHGAAHAHPRRHRAHAPS